MTRLQSTRDEAATATLTLLRVGVGGILMVHGWMKLVDIAGTTQNFAQIGVPEPQIAVYLAILGELAGGLGLVLGFLTRLAGLGAMLVMLSAIYFVHLDHGLLSREGGFEFPLLILLVGLYFVGRGGGPISVDRAIQKARARQRRASRYREPRGPISSTPAYGR